MRVASRVQTAVFVGSYAITSVSVRAGVSSTLNAARLLSSRAASHSATVIADQRTPAASFLLLHGFDVRC